MIQSNTTATAAADAEDGWTVVKPSRRSRKQATIPDTVPTLVEPPPEDLVDEYREGLSEAGKRSYDEFESRPLFCEDYGIDYNHKNSETLDTKFQRMFGLPCLSNNMPFRYFVKTGHAYNMVKEILRGESPPSLLKKAAVLEELYAY